MRARDKDRCSIKSCMSFEQTVQKGRHRRCDSHLCGLLGAAKHRVAKCHSIVGLLR